MRKIRIVKMSNFKAFKCLMFLVFGLAVNSISAQIYTVNSLLDTSDANPGDGVCDDGSVNCTLRAAIEEANASGATLIDFSISGTINLTNDLGVITAVIIDGGNAIIVDGSSAGNVHCIELFVSDVEIRNLEVVDCSNSGIYIVGGGSLSNITLDGNTISNCDDGIWTGFGGGNCTGCVISNNTISGNSNRGVRASRNQVTFASNLIQSNTTGIFIDGGADENVISQNQFDCNSGSGIFFSSGSNDNQPKPVIDEATTTSVTISNCSFGDIVEVYENHSCGTTFCQGETYLGDATDNGDGTFTLSGSFSLGVDITATSTTGPNTSQFADCMTVIDPCAGINATTIEVTNTNDSGPGSLRQAIDCVNADSTLDNIVFNIPGAGPHTIVLSSSLAVISDQDVSIDGSSDIIIDGANLNDCFLVNAQNVIFKNISISNCTWAINDDNSADCSGLLVDNCTIFDVNGGVYVLNACSNVNIINSDITAPRSILLTNCADFLIENNILDGTGTGTANMVSLGISGDFLSNNVSNYIFGLLVGTSANIKIENNTFHNLTGRAIFVAGSAHITANQFYCNGNPIDNSSGPTTPAISLATTNVISGTCINMGVIELFIDDQSCGSSPCQGDIYLGSTTADASGNWSFFGSFSIGDEIVVTATNGVMNTSEFSNCAVVCAPPLNTECSAPIPLTDGVSLMNEDNSCASSGTSIFGCTNEDQTLWYSFTTGSSTIGVDITSTLTNGFIEIYSDCNMTVVVADCNSNALSAGCGDILPNTTYLIQVGSSFADAGTFDITVSLTDSSVPNEYCSGASDLGTIICGSSLTIMNNGGECFSNVSACIGCETTWSTFMVDAGISELEVTASDIEIDIYSGADCTSLVIEAGQVGCTYPVGTILNVTTGTTYYVENHGDITLTPVCCATPSNDLCSNATPLSSGVITLADNSCSTFDGGSCTSQTSSVWFSYTTGPTEIGLDIEVTGLTGAMIEIYDDCSFTNLLYVSSFCDASNLDSSGDICLSSNTNYYIQVGTTIINEGPFNIELTAINEPAFFYCTGAESMTSGVQEDPWDFDPSSCANDDANVCSGSGGVYWYTYTTFTDSDLLIEGFEVGADIGMSIFTDCSYTPYESGSFNVSCPSTNFMQSLSCVPQNTTLYIAFYADFSFACHAMLIVTETPTALPSNDACAGALDATVTPPSGGYDFTCATSDPTDSCSQGPSLWFEYTTGAENSLEFTVNGGVAIEVYTDCANPSTQVYSSCTSPTPINACLDPNTTYYIQVIDINGLGMIEFQVTDSSLEAACCPGGTFSSTDLCSNAGILFSGTGLLGNNNFCASADVDNCSDGNNTNTLWFTFTLGSDENQAQFDFTVNDGLFDPFTAELYTDCGTTLVYDRCGQSPSSTLTFDCLIPNTTYFLQLGTSAVNSSSDFDILPAFTSNGSDICANATAYASVNCGTTINILEGTGNCSEEGSLCFQFGSGWATFTTGLGVEYLELTSITDGQIEIYSGADCDNLTLVTGQPSCPNTGTWNIAIDENTTYYVQIGNMTDLDITGICCNATLNQPTIGQLCADNAIYDLTTLNGQVLTSVTANYNWYDGNPISGSLITTPSLIDLTSISDLWIEVIDGPCVSTLDVNDPLIIDNPTIVTANWICNDNGTPSDASDDFYDITVNATNTLPGLTDQYIVEDNALNIYGPFTYGIPQMFTMPASGTSDNLVFSDADLPSCQAAQSIGPLVTCSPDCEIVNETITNIQCNDNGTPSNPTDDFITFDLNPSGFNLGLGASYDLDQGVYTTVPTFGTYGTTTTFATLPGTAGGGDLPGLITDGIDLGCALMFNISDPGSCSMECDLLDAGWDGTSSCNEAGSTNDPTDDFITFTLDPSGFNQGTSYTVSVPSGSISPTTAVYGSGTVFTLQNGSAGLGSIIVTIADGVDPLCSIDVTISDPGPCCSTPPDIVNPGSQVACDLFNLPTITGTNLTGGEAYYNNNQVSGGAQIVGPITSTQTVWIYDGNPTCEDEESFIVTINTSPTASVPIITVCSNAQANYDLTIHNPSVGIGTITWYDGQPSGAGVLIAPDNAVDLSTITDLWVLLTDGNGCTDEAQVPIQVDTPPLPTISGDTDFCNGQTVAMLTVDQTYAMYAWSNSQPTQAITVNTANTYQVTVTDANGCTGVTSIVVSENTPPIPTITGDNTICEGQETIMLDAGIGYITYDWGSGPSATSSFDVTLAGNYSVTVTDANGCTGEDTFVVSANTVTPPNITGSLTYCVGSSTVLDAGVYTGYTWSPNGETSQSITVSSAGNYEVTVTDVNGCTSSSMVSVSEDPNLSIVIGGSTMYCPGEATIVDAGGGFSLYNWSTGGLGQFESINSPGVVSVTVTDVTGCTGSSTVTISESIVTMPDLDYTDFCDGDMSSIAVVNGPFADYLWSDASNGSTLDVGINGNYSLTVTDANGCTSESSIAVTAFTNPSPSITGLATVCPGGSGSTTLGTANTYTSYQWSTSAVSPSIVITSAGNYSVTVTDANGCTGISTIPVTEFTSPTVNISGSTSYCPGSATTLDAGGGFASYLWSPNGETTPTISVSNVGTVAVTITDVNGCTASSAVNVTEDASLNPSITGSAIFCQGESTELDAGAGFVNYQWSTTETNQSITVSSAGIYEVTVSDAGGCTGTSMLTATEAIPIVPTMSNTQYCIGESTIISMTPTYSSYVWDDASSGPTIIVSADGTYGVTVTDNNGCTASSMLMVNADTPPSPTISGVLGLCPGGMTTLDAGAGYTDYAWSPSGSGQMQGVTAAGNYTVTVTDANGCTGESSVVVNQNLAPAAVISGSTSYCPGLSTTLDAGVGFVGYAWSPNGETTQTISVATANTYTVTVTDANGCTSSSLVSVTEQSSLSPTIIGSAVFCQGESTVLDAGAGFANYQWSTTETSQSITVSNAGIYEVTVSDAGGCTGTSMLMVTENPELTLDVLTVVGVTDCDNPNGEVFLQANGGSPMYTFTWLPDLTNTNTLLNADIGTYVITVTDQLGCTASSTAIVMDEGGCGCLNAATLPMPTVCNDDLNNFNFADFISSDADDGTWTLLDIGTGDNTTIVVTPSIISIDDTTLPGTYVFEYCTTIQSGGSCVECSQQTLTVVSSPIATLIQTNVQACNAMPQGESGQSNILDITSYLDSNSDFGTWSDNAGLLLGGQPSSAVDFTGLTIGTEVIFTYQTTTGAGLCPEVSVELTVLIIDCQCPVITLDPLPNVCNSGETLDLNQYSGGSDPGSWTIQDITGDLSTLQFDDLANTISIDMATVPGDYQVTYTLDNAAVGCPESQVAVFTVVASPATVTFAEAFACNEVNVTGSALSNVLDLTSYILSGSTAGTWTSPLVGLDLSDPTAVDFTGLMTSSPITLTYTTADAILPCQDEAYEFIVTIVDCTCPDISLDPLPQVCNDGQVVYLSNAETLDTDPGSWSFISGPSNVNLIGDSLSTDALIAGVYTFEFTLDIQPPTGCQASNSLLLDVTQTANSGTPDNLGTYCQGEETILDLNDLLIGEDIGGEWTDVSTSPAASFDGLTGQFDISVQASGTYEFMYVVTGVSPCADAMTTIEVVIEPAIIADVGLGGALDCITSELQLGGGLTSSGPNYTYQWIGPASSALGTEPELVVQEVGTYQLVVTDVITGCSTAESITITAGSNTTIAQDTVIALCSEEVFMICDTIYQAMDIPQVVTCVDPNGVCQTEYAIDATIFTSPMLDDQLYVFTEFQQTVDILVNSNAAILERDSLSIIENEDFSYTISDDGQININLVEGFTGTTVFEAILCNLDCIECDTANISILKKRSEFTEAVLTPNGDGQNETFIIDGYNENLADEYPQNNITIFNRWGQVVFTKDGYDNDWTGDYQDRTGQPLPEGTYYFELFLGAGRSDEAGQQISVFGSITILR